MKSLDHIFKPKAMKKQLREMVNSRIKEEKNRLKTLGISGEELEYRLKVFRLTEMKKTENGTLTGWQKLRKSQKNSMSNYLLFQNKLEGIAIQQMNYSLPRNVKTHEDFTRYILRQNLFTEIFVDLQKYVGKSSFPCFLFPGNWASISKGENGIYHYFTNRPEGISLSLNIFDLIEIICSSEEETFANHRRRLIDFIGCTYPEQRWEMKQFNKIQLNNNSISNANKDWHKQYPSLFKLTGNYLDILLALNSHNERYINSKHYSYEKESLFFLSSRYLADILDRDPSNVRRAINLFACLGLIVKVPPDVEKFPQKFLQSAVKISGNIPKYKLVTFYIIPQITQRLLRNAEIKAKKLLDNKITNITKLNEKKMAIVFGEDYARGIYYSKEIDIQQLVKKSEVDLSECKQADTFKTKREINRLKAEQGNVGDDAIPF